MSDLKRRLSALARQAGFPVHISRLWCPVCDVPEPLPGPLSTGVGDFIEAIFARVGVEGVRAACLRVVPPPEPRSCWRCGGPRQCASCQEAYGKAIFDAIALTATEQATWEALLAECRAQDSKRNSHGEW
jgi:hypothetical protein